MCADRNAELAQYLDQFSIDALPNGTVVQQPQGQALRAPLLAQAAPVAAPGIAQPNEIALENRAMAESSPFFVTVPCICCCFFKQFVPG